MRTWQSLRGRVAALFALALAALLIAASGASAAGTAVKLGEEPTPGAVGLPDGRAYEEVTPSVKYGAEAGFSRGAELLDQSPLYSVASANGESVLFTESGAFGNTFSGLDLYGVAHRRPQGGWETDAALPPVIEEPNGIADLPTYFYPSANLERFAFTGEGKPYISGAAAESPAGPDRGLSPNLYLTSGGEGSAPSYAVQPQWLSRPEVASIVPELGKMASTEELSIAGASPTLSRVYFAYRGTLMPEDAARGANVKTNDAWGFYEWSESKLHEAGRLPGGGLDAYGAEPAGLEPGNANNNPESYSHEIAAGGGTAFFVSPVTQPSTISKCEAEKYAGPGGCVPELYARIHEGATTRTVLVSRSELTHEPAATQPLIMQSGQSVKGLVRAYAAPDGSRVFFVDKAALTAAAEAAPAGSYKVYEDDLTARGGEGEVVYRPAMNTVAPGGVVGASANGTSLIYYEGTAEPYTLNYWHLKADGEEEVTKIAEVHVKIPGELDLESMFVTASGSAFVFDTPRALTLASSPSTQELNPAGKYREVYRYVPSATGGTLSCLSCGKGTPTGNATLSNDAQQNRKRAVGSRGMNAAGTEVFFDTPEALVPQDVNHTRDVYEWEAPGTGSCAAGNAGGCDYLISSGTSPEESFILDNGESGSNVFFATTSALAPGDNEGGYDVYDARVMEGTPAITGTAPCANNCEQAVPPATPPGTLSAAAGPSGNLVPPPPPKRHSGRSGKPGKRGKARARRLHRCRKAAGHRKRGAKRRRALRRCARRFGRAASHGHRHGRHRGAKHHGHRRGHGRAGGTRRRG